ncbi:MULTISPECIES: P63C domain-containing protein [Aeromonas]|uniref:P63C domain-containing protein n=1 Tax=Aeromonas TaxID=642 RepID=UPI002B474AD9|nr:MULTISPECIES: P63C domain-containing protein [Aeromonas]
MEKEKPTGRAVGGKARMANLTPEERKEISAKAAKAKAELAKLPKATHFGTLPFGDDLQCFVLNDGRRVISGRGMTEAIGMKGRGPGVMRIADHKLIRAYGDTKLIDAINNPIKFVGKNPKGSSETSDGFEAEVLGQVCEAILTARDNGLLTTEQDHRYAQHADTLMRGFARVGLVALIDEATGYQNDRNRDELAKILEAFVTRELRPWVPTFPPEFYERLYKLYELPWPPERANARPGFFGHITNNVIYDRLAPSLLPELKAAASKAERKARLHQFLTEDIGHPALRAHLHSIVTLLRIAKTPEQFFSMVDEAFPKFGTTGQGQLDLVEKH